MTGFRVWRLVPALLLMLATLMVPLLIVAAVSVAERGACGGFARDFNPLSSPGAALGSAARGRAHEGLLRHRGGLLPRAGHPDRHPGPGAMDDDHQPDEAIDRAQLALCVEVLGRLVRSAD